MATVTDEITEYRAAYERGWRAGRDGTDGVLDRAIGRGESDGWIDGYMDRSIGREKWHMLNCPDHDVCGKA